MNNFYDLQDTDISLTLMIELVPHYQMCAPEIRVCANKNQLFEGILTQPNLIEFQIPLLSIFDIQIQLINKNYIKDSTTAVLINQLSLDNHQLIPNWTHLAQYSNDHNYQQPTSHLGFNGTWKLSITRPFYQWWHVATGQGWLLEPDLT